MSDTYSVLVGGVAHRVFTHAGNAERDAENRAAEIALATGRRAIVVVLRAGDKSQAIKRVIGTYDAPTNKVRVVWGGWVKHKEAR